MKKLLYFLLFTIIYGCNAPSEQPVMASLKSAAYTGVSLTILGNVQDAGSPHVGCKKSCCAGLYASGDLSRKVVCLGVLDHGNKKSYMLEATPDMPWQMKQLSVAADWTDKQSPDGIFVTHAHIGHYTGLMYLGKEALGASGQKVYAMPAMATFLSSHGPWSQLVRKDNIDIDTLTDRQPVVLSSDLAITPFRVPHRDEFSETVGYYINGPNKVALFIPDIDKWERWEESIVKAIAEVDYAFVDGTFYDAAEIDNRDISLIPHPFITESMSKFEYLAKAEKDKIYFIHLNHTNKALNPQSAESQTIRRQGYHVARQGEVFEL